MRHLKIFEEYNSRMDSLLIEFAPIMKSEGIPEGGVTKLKWKHDDEKIIISGLTQNWGTNLYKSLIFLKRKYKLDINYTQESIYNVIITLTLL